MALIEARAHFAFQPLENLPDGCIVGKSLGLSRSVQWVMAAPGTLLGRVIGGIFESDKLGPLERPFREMRHNVHNRVPRLADAAGRVPAGLHKSGHFPQRVDILTEGDSSSRGRIWGQIQLPELLYVKVLEEQVDHLGLEDMLCMILDAGGACRQGAAKVEIVTVLGIDPTPILAFQLAAEGSCSRCRILDPRPLPTSRLSCELCAVLHLLRLCLCKTRRSGCGLSRCHQIRG